MKRRDFLHAAAAATALSATASALHAQEAEPKLTFDTAGKFKIAQFTDTHYRVDKKDIAVESVRLIGETIDAEKPQLAVYTGDIVTNGKKFDGNVTQGWDDILAPCIERKVPYAVVFGNHDHENAEMPRRKIAEYIAQKPYSLLQPNPETVHGDTSYILEILNGDKPANLLYCLDSLNYSSTVHGYDWFRPNQIQWYREQSAAYTQKNGGKPVPALAFFHIPFNEYCEMIHFKVRDKRTLIGTRYEDECPGAVNSGMFLAMRECGDTVGTFVGHDHVNDYIGLWYGIALTYGRWSGTKTTYGGDKKIHGSRLIELSKDGGRTFRTWIRQRGGEKFDEISVPQDLTAKPK
ncbi:MAG: metallophosphoesterase family protein [Planctomycetaceae bacterium]|jgi:hypothetical protein|nr:metallophosphoesterase family protein [Planctomycetaceae bacterium]